MRKALFLILALVCLSPELSAQVTSADPQSRWRDTDYSLPNGLWRWRFNGPVTLEYNTDITGGFGTYTVSMSMSTSGVVTFLNNPIFSSFTANSFVYSGTGGALTSTAAPTNGQFPIGSTGAAPVLSSLTGTSNQLTVTNGAGSITLSLAGPHNVTTLTSNGVLYGNGTGAIQATAQGPANSVLTANAGAPAFSATPTLTSLTTTSTITAVGAIESDAAPSFVANPTNNYAAVRFSNNGVAKGFIGADYSQSITSTSNNGDMVIRADGGNTIFSSTTTERMRLTSAGLLGIGGTPTTGTLDVFGSGFISANFRSTGAAGGYFQIYDSTNSAVRGAIGYGSQVATGAAITDFIVGGSAALKFATNLGISGTTAMTIDTSQNVGIGAAPSLGILHITKNADGNTALNITNTSTGTAAYSSVQFTNAVHTSSIYHLGSAFTSSGQYVQDSLLIESGGAGGLELSAFSTAGPIRMFTGSPIALAVTVDSNQRITGSSSAGGSVITLTGAGTNSQYISYNTTGGTSYIGMESSVGGNIITGSAAYSLSISSAVGRQLVLGTNGGTAAMTIDTSQQPTFTGSTNGFWNVIIKNSSTGASAVTRLELGTNASDGTGQILAYGGNHSTLPNTVDLNAASGSLRLLSNNTLAMTISTGQNIGIGVVPSGSYRLEVSGGGGVKVDTGFVVVRDGNDSAGAGALYALSNAATTRQWYMQLSASNHLDFQYYNGSAWTNEFRMTSGGQLLGSNGSTTVPTFTFGNETNTGMYLTSGVLNFTVQGTTSVQLTNSVLSLASGTTLGWNGDTTLRRLTANQIQQINGNNTQSFWIGSNTGAENLVLLKTNSGVGQIYTDTARSLQFGVNNAIKWLIDGSTYAFYPSSDNSADIGHGGGRIAHAYIGTLLHVGATNDTSITGLVGSTPIYSTTSVASATNMTLVGLGASANPVEIDLFKTRNTATAVGTPAQNGDGIWTIQGWVDSTSAYLATGSIRAVVDGTFSSGQRPPSRLEFYSNIANGSQTLYLTLSGNGHFKMGATASVTTLTGATAAHICYDATATVANTFSTCTSLRELKDDIAYAPSGLDMLMKLQPVSFRFKPSSDRYSQEQMPYQYGFIAEDVYAVDPKLSTFYQGKLNGVNFDGITAVLTKSAQELYIEIESLKRRLAVLEGRN